MLSAASDLGLFIDASPSPFHTVQQIVSRLVANGYFHYDHTDNLPGKPGKYVITRAGSLIAIDLSEGYSSKKSLRIIGAHTDSPNLRVKRHANTTALGVHQLLLEPYGGALLHTWLDRDLILAGRVVTLEQDQVKNYLFVSTAIVKIPSLAIHLSSDRTNPNVNPQLHLDAFFSRSVVSFECWLAEQVGVSSEVVRSFDVMTADSQLSGLIGMAGEFLSAPRLDNLASCHAALSALLSLPTQNPVIPVIVLFDHEEVGSKSERGADSDFLISTLERLSVAADIARGDFLTQLSRSVFCSADMAHATHPNYSERHEPHHNIIAGAGPVVKINYQLRYATDGMGEAYFVRACEHAGVPLQHFINRADQACGSTIGPISAARAGIITVDVGAPQWGMHSIRETMVAADVEMYTRALTSFLQME